jgi:hypothetical protein
MCKETKEDLDRLVQEELSLLRGRLKDKKTKEFDKWWNGKIIGWFDAARGNPAKTRKILGLEPCECPKSATN